MTTDQLNVTFVLALCTEFTTNNLSCRSPHDHWGAVLACFLMSHSRLLSKLRITPNSMTDPYVTLRICKITLLVFGQCFIENIKNTSPFFHLSLLKKTATPNLPLVQPPLMANSPWPPRISPLTGRCEGVNTLPWRGWTLTPNREALQRCPGVPEPAPGCSRLLRLRAQWPPPRQLSSDLFGGLFR